LSAIGHEFVLEGLKALHDTNILGLIMTRNWERTEYRRGRTVVSLLHVHLVFVTKYRRDVLSERAIGVVRDACLGVCNDFTARLVELNGEDDHVHMLVEYPTTIALSRLVNSLKGVSSRMLRARNFPQVQRRLWGGHLWSPSYFAVSCGGAPIEIVRKYIEDQRL
jgi:putative transposase